MGGLESVNEQIPVVSVAGTNGKGSLVSFLNSILIKTGKKTGAYTSPHIFRFNERIRINGKEISSGEFRDALRKVRGAQRKAGAVLTKFEKITATGILHFYVSGCDYSIMEAGLGGRLDATNICENKIVSVITPISLEHTEYLGDTLEKIAREKAGIIKPGVPVVDASGIPLIREYAASLGSPVYTSGREYSLENLKSGPGGRYTYDLRLEGRFIRGVSPALRGLHQAHNSAQAAIAASILGVGDCDIKSGIASASHPGRLEIFEMGAGRKFIVDAAHNPAGVRVLKEYLEARPDSAQLYLIIGVFKDKDYRTISEILQNSASAVWTVSTGGKRGLDAGELARRFSSCKPAYSFYDAFKSAERSMNDGDWLAACGSFSVVKPALEYAYENFS